MDVEPAEGVWLVPDLLEGFEPFGKGVTIERPDIMTKQSARSGVDHVVPDSRQIDHSSILVACDRQVGNQCHLVPVRWSAVNLVCPR